MPASIIASFFSFLLTGIWTFFIASSQFSIPNEIKWFLLFVILFTSFYFFYIEALTEIDESIRSKLKNKSKMEWFIRIINQTILYMLWFLFQYNLLYFAIGLFLLYIGFIVWDIVTGEDCQASFKITDKFSLKVFYIDVLGCIFAVFFIILCALNIYYLPNNSDLVTHDNVVFYLGVVSVLYILVLFFGLLITRFELFNGKYWNRNAII
jgi:hypothetical protein